MAAELLQAGHRLRKAGPQKKIDGSMRGEAFVLQYVSLCGGEVIPSEISGEMEISSARIAAALNSMEGKGLVTRRIDPGDRRRILVKLTREGQALADEFQQIAVNEMVRMLRLLGEWDAREYVRITGRLAELLTGLEE